MGVMLQNGGIYPGIRAGEAAACSARHYGHRRRADELLAMVGLTDRARSTWRQLSGGEQQRLSLALALAGAPDVLFLDEPTASVDVAGRQQVAPCSGRCVTRAAASSSPPTSSRRPSGWPTPWSSSTAAGSWPTVTPVELSRALPPEEIRFGAPPGSTWRAWAPPSARW